jgi:hypothetical protein
VRVSPSESPSGELDPPVSVRQRTSSSPVLGQSATE